MDFVIFKSFHVSLSPQHQASIGPFMIELVNFYTLDWIGHYQYLIQRDYNVEKIINILIFSN